MTTFTYEAIAHEMLSRSKGVPLTTTWHPIAYATTARFMLDEDDMPTIIGIELHGSMVAKLFDQNTAVVWHCGFPTTTTQRRINSVLKPLGYVVISRKYNWYLLEVATQRTKVFDRPMIVQRKTPTLTVSTENRSTTK